MPKWPVGSMEIMDNKVAKESFLNCDLVAHVLIYCIHDYAITYKYEKFHFFDKVLSWALLVKEGMFKII